MDREEIDKLWRSGYATKFIQYSSGIKVATSLLLTNAGLHGKDRVAVLIEAMKLLEEEET